MCSTVLLKILERNTHTTEIMYTQVRTGLAENVRRAGDLLVMMHLRTGDRREIYEQREITRDWLAKECTCLFIVGNLSLLWRDVVGSAGSFRLEFLGDQQFDLRR